MLIISLLVALFPAPALAENLAPAKDRAKFASVECYDGALDCHPAVGMLTLTTLYPEAAGQCTAFLVAPNVVATNSHCVPDDLKAAGSVCTDRIWMHFAQTAGFAAETQECARVIFDSRPKSSVEADYAYLELAQSSARPALVLSREGLRDNEEVFVQKVNPVASSPEGYLRGKQMRVNCLAVQNSYLLRSFFHPFAEVATLTRCSIIAGNSGSPVLAADGSVRATIFFALLGSKIREILSQYSWMVFPEKMHNVNFAANFACLRSWDNSPLPEHCSSLPKLSEQPEIGPFEEHFDADSRSVRVPK